MEKITLFYEERPEIKISMQVYFTESGALYFDGYDFGTLVKELSGRSDYEYAYTVAPAETEKLYAVYNLHTGDKTGLLQMIKDNFSCNEAYSLFGKFMTDNGIVFSNFIWR